MGSPIVMFDKAEKKVSIEVREQGTTEWKDELTYTMGKPIIVEVRLRVPSGLSDVHWTVETTKGGSFFRPQLCDGRRSFAKGHDTPLPLEISGTADTVDVYAGWATGYSAVSMTAPLVLVGRAGGGDDDGDGATEQEL